MNPNLKFYEVNGILAKRDPVSVAASTVLTAYVTVANFHSIVALLQTGTLGASATIDAKLRQATDSSGTGVKDITGKAITQLTQAGTDMSNSIVSIECRAEDLDAANGFGFVCLSVTVGTAASVFGALLMGRNPRYFPASANNAAAVLQQV